ncbi:MULTISPECIES: hypothetical protein [unclassified Bradyrhizobium]|uniref:hypothetical protein n=1 Tax=unclassified Bradyrhizobium TaxID=2631580 RepID=UPI0033940295
MVRKIVLPVKGAKAAAPAVAKPVTAAPARKVAAKPQTPAVTLPPKRERAKVERIEHTVTSPYAGPSLGLNKRKSTTALDLATFGTQPDYVLTMRTEQVGKALKAKYGTAPFARGNADAGILKYLGRKGYIRHVDGDPSAETSRFAFTDAAFK